jgi:hypothetical protein
MVNVTMIVTMKRVIETGVNVMEVITMKSMEYVKK